MSENLLKNDKETLAAQQVIDLFPNAFVAVFILERDNSGDFCLMHNAASKAEAVQTLLTMLGVYSHDLKEPEIVHLGKKH